LRIGRIPSEPDEKQSCNRKIALMLRNLTIAALLRLSVIDSILENRGMIGNDSSGWQTGGQEGVAERRLNGVNDVGTALVLLR